MSIRVILLSSLVFLPVFASSASAADLAKGKASFETLCASCHGNTGAGDGPVAAALPPEMKPRNLQEAHMKFATDDAKFTLLLKQGGAAVGLSPMMPPQPTLTDEDITNIIAFVRSLKK